MPRSRELTMLLLTIRLLIRAPPTVTLVRLVLTMFVRDPPTRVVFRLMVGRLTVVLVGRLTIPGRGRLPWLAFSVGRGFGLT
jgi:hypothetical protein